MDLALNNLQRLICHKTQQTKPNQIRILGKKVILRFLFYVSFLIRGYHGCVYPSKSNVTFKSKSDLSVNNFSFGRIYFSTHF